MKKPLSLILLSSAILLPTHAAEASTTKQVQTQTYTWNASNHQVYSYYYGNYHYQKPQQPSRPVEKPTVQQPTQPNQPVEKPQTNKPAQQQTANVSATEQAVLDLTNAERTKAGLKPLQIDAALQKSAKQKSADMAANNYFSHTSPTYGSPFDQMKQNGVTYRSAAENIAMGQRSAQEVVKAWMNSAGHRQNILTPGFTHIGIGYDANGQYWTQQFIQK
ncbi:CAP domain-containing protein [Sporosarcina ureae]|uniref:CAP domain-containing protein n=1 Tax=Sporosarcina ureae TaxID=1571 RepID=UPI0026EBF31E|nr:CAP domain-containing protein [Sporosarcina ureae]